jgi:HAD superfamily hydrolase (TIGR01490 family)
MSHSEWPSFEKPPAVAFVDVDGTLLAQTTTFLFARILYRRGLISRSFWLRALYHGLQHRFGRLDYGRLIAIGLNSIARIPIVELERIAYENFVEHVRPRLYEGVVEHMYELRRTGTAIVLVSSSPGLVIEPLSIYLGCTDTLTTPVLIERGRLAGIGSGPPCYGEGKLFWAEDWARAHQIRMEDAVAYADNWSDWTLLAHVGRAVVVQPRGRLLRLARARGWDMVWPRRPRRRKSRWSRAARRERNIADNGEDRGLEMNG